MFNNVKISAYIDYNLDYAENKTIYLSIHKANIHVLV